MTDSALAVSPATGAAAPADLARPVQPVERIELLDVLRGVALLGILLVNWGSNYLSQGALDDVLSFGFDGSFRLLFSFVFGLGFAVQLIRAESRGRPVVPRYLWRTFLLLLIGAAHYTLIWSGDIANRYAVTAVLLLFFYRWRPGPLLGAAAVVMLFHMAPLAILNPSGQYWQRANPEMAEQLGLEQRSRQYAGFNLWARRQQAVAEGSYADRIAAIGGEFRSGLQQAYSLPVLKSRADLLCLFLLGLWAGRRRILHDPRQHRRLLLGILGTGLIVGLAGNAVDVAPGWIARIGIDTPEWFSRWRFTYDLGSIGMTAFYVSGVTLLFTYRERAQRALSVFRHAGRMSLTNYIMQGVILTALSGDGSLFPRGPLQDSLDGGWRIALLVAVFAFQVGYSRWWFRHFEFGPIEWAWRSLTWFRWQSMRAARTPTLHLSPMP